MGNPAHVENKRSFAIDFTELSIWDVELTANQHTTEQERPLISFLLE